MKILMVCLGNICRSPLAEGILKHKVQQQHLDWIIDSAGTQNDHIGEAPHVLSQKVSLLHGIDISQQRARKFVATDIKNFDKIYAMANDVLLYIQQIAGKQYDEKKVCLFMDELYPHKQIDVPDPWYGAEDGYHKVFDMLNKTCDAIIKKYTTN